MNPLRLILLLFSLVCIFSCQKEAYTEKESDALSMSAKAGTSSLVLAEDFAWGVNGHPLTQEAYKGNIDLQLSLIQKVGMTWYRVDVPVDTSGVVRQPALMDELLQKAKVKGISILPMVYLTGWDKSTDETDAFRRGRKIGFGFATTYASAFQYYEMGNEEECKLLKGGNGDKASDYNLPKFSLLAAFLRGMNEGIKSADPEARTIINNSGWLHYGYFQLLKDYKVNYDILGLHWYSDMGDLNNAKGNGDVLAIMASFGKPVWITEINRRNGSWNNGSNSGESDQVNWINRYICQLNQRQYVGAFFVYELFDEPVFASTDPAESAYGIVSWDTPYSGYTPKSVMTALQYGVEITVRNGRVGAKERLLTFRKPL